MGGNDPLSANAIGQLALLIGATACILSFRGIPWWMWSIAYVCSVFTAPILWKEKAGLTVSGWLLYTAVSGGLTALLYFIGFGLFGSSHQPWAVFRVPGIFLPAIALDCLSGVARSAYIRFRSENAGTD